MSKRSLLVLLLAACATLGDDPPAPTDLPSAGMGPFRALQNQELKGAAPFVLDDSQARYSDVAALSDPAVSSDAVIVYAVSVGRILRTRSLDGRSFYGIGQAGRAPAVVLEADAAWEGDALSGPFARRAGAEVFLYYAGLGGIGLARSADGLTFTKEPGPVLAGAFGGPSVFVLPSGEQRMMFTSAAGIEEARSADGVSWRRIPGVVLGPSGTAFDASHVSDPWVATRTTPAGRFHVRVLYTGTSATGATAIGLAARYGDDGPLIRNPEPAFPSGAEPAYVAPFLYVTQTRVTYPAIAAGIAPLDATISAALDYPASP